MNVVGSSRSTNARKADGELNVHVKWTPGAGEEQLVLLVPEGALTVADVKLLIEREEVRRCRLQPPHSCGGVVSSNSA